VNLQEVIDSLGLEILTGGEHLAREVSGGYASDLLSDVMAHARAGHLWVTLQIHQNIIAVAVLKDLAGIIIVQGREPDPGTQQKARDESVCLLRTQLPAFDIIGKLYRMLRDGNP
jgi:hypothetical protein